MPTSFLNHEASKPEWIPANTNFFRGTLHPAFYNAKIAIPFC
jgi:hypothetical protein